MKRLAASAVAMGGLGLGARRYRRDLAAAQRRLSHPAASPQRVQTSAGTVEFVELGHGEPVLVLHGNGGGWDQSVDWVHRRLGQGFRSISPARFGYLGSTLPPGADPALQADVLVELLDQLDLNEVAVVSLSAGSITAAHLAARHPDRVRTLLLESPVAPTHKPLRQPPVAVFSALAHSEVLFWLTSSLPALVAAASGVALPSPDDAAHLVDRLPAGRLLQVPSGGHLLLGNVERLRSAVGDFLHR